LRRNERAGRSPPNPLFTFFSDNPNADASINQRRIKLDVEAVAGNPRLNSKPTHFTGAAACSLYRAGVGNDDNIRC
jgi:hypothetical protein